MYALVYKNKVIVGPMEWNRGIFEGSLKKENVKALIPLYPSEELPYIINEDSKILRVQENRPLINSSVEYHYGPIWDLSGSIAIENYEVHDVRLEDAKQNLKAVIANERWLKETSSVNITLQDVVVTINVKPQEKYMFLQKYFSMSTDEVVNWKFPEGWLTLTKDEINSIIVKFDSHTQEAFDWEKQKCDEIDACSSKEQLLLVKLA
jgi:hypothetical protein